MPTKSRSTVTKCNNPSCCLTAHKLTEALKDNKRNLICAYCGLPYLWINHRHTQGFYEHQGKGECKFYMHKILEGAN